MKKQTLLRGILLLLIIGLVAIISPNQTLNRDSADSEYLKAVVGSVMVSTDPETGQSKMKTRVVLEETGGYIDIDQSLSINAQETLKDIKAGDKVIVIKSSAGVNVSYNILDYQRTDALYLVGILSVVILIVIARKNGIKTLFTLGFSAYVLFSYFVPSLSQSQNFVLPLLISCLLISVGSFLVLDGYSYKGLISIVSTILGVIISMVLAYILLRVFRISGLINEEYTALYAMNQDSLFDAKGLFFSAVIIGSLGAIMDVAMSLTSSLVEIVSHNPHIKRKELFKSGLRIGNDTLSTMSSTLLLAYLSGALPMMILLTQYQYSMTYILNSSWFIAEIIQALVGVMTLLWVVPLTCALYIGVESLTVKIKD